MAGVGVTVRRGGIGILTSTLAITVTTAITDGAATPIIITDGTAMTTSATDIWVAADAGLPQVPLSGALLPLQVLRWDAAQYVEAELT